MNVQFNTALANICRAVKASLAGSVNLRGALQEFAPIYNKMKPEDQQPALLKIAHVVAQKYGCTAKIGSRGVVTFVDANDVRDDASAAAAKWMRYNIGLESKAAKGTREPADPVDTLIKRYEKLTAAQKRAFRTKAGW